MIFLAAPYYDRDANVRYQRFLAVRDVSAVLLRRGVTNFCPIAYGRQYELHYEMAADFRTWQPMNDKILLACEAMWIYMLPGWDKSGGVLHETKLAQANSIPVFRFLNIDERHEVI